jgi:hypothetical protein
VRYKVRTGKIKNARGILVGSLKIKNLLGGIDMDGGIEEKVSSPCSQQLTSGNII